METHVAPHVFRTTAGASLSRLGQSLLAGGALLREWAQRLDGWIGDRDRASADHSALAAMSARELRDIGLDATHVCGRADAASVRDWAA